MGEFKKEIKRNNKIRIAKFISRQGFTSKSEITSRLGISMPTTLQNVKELMQAGIVKECGEYQSTGGRKAKALSIASDAAYAVGMDITAHHITLVLVNMRRELVQKERLRMPFADELSYYKAMGEQLEAFIKRADVGQEKIQGVGISLPGIVDREEKALLISHVVTFSGKSISFKEYQKFIGFPFELENDANSAARAEFMEISKNAVYLSLSGTVGGAICLGGRMYRGEQYKSGEFGHMIIEKNGRTCYCGKKGCVDAYCASGILEEAGGTLDGFFEKLEKGDLRCRDIWEEYLDYLALAVANLRMAFDCDIVLGGYVGGYLEEFLPALNRKIRKYNNFDRDTSYVRTGRYKLEAAAYGATLPFVERFFESL